jgi:hypothetical protein
MLKAICLYEAVERLFRARRGNPTKTKWLSILKRVSEEVGHTATSQDLVLRGISPNVFYMQFGGLRNAQHLAGLKPNAIGRVRMTERKKGRKLRGAWESLENEHLLEMLRKTAEETLSGKTPSVVDMLQHCGVPMGLWTRRFGGIARAQQLAGLKPNSAFRRK